MIRKPVTGKVHRSGVRKKRDKRVFSRTADKAHFINATRPPMRGGIRL